MALTAAEYLAFEKNMHVLVILTDITNYADSLREVSAARKEVPDAVVIRDICIQTLHRFMKENRKAKGRNGSITMIPDSYNARG